MRLRALLTPRRRLAAAGLALAAVAATQSGMMPAGSTAAPPAAGPAVDPPAPLLPPVLAPPPLTVDPQTEPHDDPDGAASDRASRGSTREAAAPAPYVAPLITSTAVPRTVLRAYRQARRTMHAAAPACRLDVALLAAIGRVESAHANGGVLDGTGRTVVPILGPRLDGSPGLARIRDTDGGLYDGDTKFDRAVGPMQFIPGTWVGWASDGNGDGIGDPSNVFDAALAAGRYLCSGGGSLDRPADLKAAVLRYNASTSYYRTVLAWRTAYAGGSVPGAAGATKAADAKAAKAANVKSADVKSAEAAEARAAGKPAQTSPAAPPAQDAPKDTAAAPKATQPPAGPPAAPPAGSPKPDTAPKKAPGDGAAPPAPAGEPPLGGALDGLTAPRAQPAPPPRD